jgi:hypothetical protein
MALELLWKRLYSACDSSYSDLPVAGAEFGGEGRFLAETSQRLYQID